MADIISGYAAVFYDGSEPTEYRLGRNVKERIMPGAFDRALREADEVIGVYNHNPSNLLGRTDAGTLRLSIDSKGLRYEIDKPETSLGRDVFELQSRGDLKGSSFAFVPEDVEERREGDMIVVEQRSVRLFDVGPVTHPAYSATNQPRSGKDPRRSVRWTRSSGRPLDIPEEHCTREVRRYRAILNFDEIERAYRE